MPLCPFFSVSFLKARIFCYVTTAQLNVGNSTWMQYFKRKNKNHSVYSPFVACPNFVLSGIPSSSPSIQGHALLLATLFLYFSVILEDLFTVFVFFFYDAGLFGEHGRVSLESVPQLGLLEPCFLTVWFSNACLAGELQKGHGVLLWVISKATWCPSAPHWWA